LSDTVAEIRETEFKDYLATDYHSVFNAIITVMHKSSQQL